MKTFREWMNEKEGKEKIELSEAKEAMSQEVLDILSKYGFSEKTKSLRNYLKDKNSDKMKQLQDFVKEALKGEIVKDTIPISYLLLNSMMNGSDVVGKKYKQTRYSQKLTFDKVSASLNNKSKMDEWKELMSDWFSSVKPATLEKWSECIKELDIL